MLLHAIFRKGAVLSVNESHKSCFSSYRTVLLEKVAHTTWECKVGKEHLECSICVGMCLYNCVTADSNGHLARIYHQSAHCVTRVNMST